MSVIDLATFMLLVVLAERLGLVRRRRPNLEVLGRGLALLYRAGGRVEA